MSHWNHRLIMHEDPFGSWCAIHEVYYDEEGHIWGWTQNIDGDSPVAEDVDGMREVLLMMLRACDKPILVLKDGHLFENGIEILIRSYPYERK